MQTEENLSVKPERDLYEKPVCRVNIFTAEDLLMTLPQRKYDGGHDSEDNGWL